MKKSNSNGNSNAPMLLSLEKTRREGKNYEEFVMQAHSMERLLANPDFKRYQEVLRESFLLLVKQFQLAGAEKLVFLQGALCQHDFIMDLPKRLIDEASNQIADRREAEERQDGA